MLRSEIVDKYQIDRKVFDKIVDMLRTKKGYQFEKNHCKQNMYSEKDVEIIRQLVPFVLDGVNPYDAYVHIFENGPAPSRQLTSDEICKCLKINKSHFRTLVKEMEESSWPFQERNNIRYFIADDMQEMKRLLQTKNVSAAPVSFGNKPEVVTESPSFWELFKQEFRKNMSQEAMGNFERQQNPILSLALVWEQQSTIHPNKDVLSREVKLAFARNMMEAENI